MLKHTPEAVALDRFKVGASHRDGHFGDQIGVIDDAWLEDRKLRVKVRYGKGERAEEIFQDVVDGIRRNISIRYDILEEREINVGDKVVYEVTRWEPVHTAEVPDPADPTVGHGRAKDDETFEFDAAGDVEEQVSELAKRSGIRVISINNNEEGDMPALNMSNEEQQRLAEEREKALEAERQKGREEAVKERAIEDMKEMYALAGEFQRNAPASDLLKDAEAFTREGKSVSEFLVHCRTKIEEQNEERKATNGIGLSDKETEEYSFREIVLAQIHDDRKQREYLNDKYAEMSRAVAKEIGVPAKGMYVPPEVMNRRSRALARPDAMPQNGGLRDLVVGTPASGGYTVQYEYPEWSMIELLQKTMVTGQAGVRPVYNLVGNIPVTRRLTNFTAYWAGEASGPTESGITFGQSTMSPKKVGVLGGLSYEFIIQSSLSAESYVESRILEALRLEADRVILYGTGTTNQPKGLKNTSGIGSESGAGFTRDSAINMEGDLLDSNAAGLGDIVWVTRGSTRGVLKKKKVDEGSGVFLVGNDNKLIDYRTIVSNQVIAGDLFGGIWNQILAGYWGTMDVLANRYGDGYAAGDVELRALQLMDIMIEQPGAFSVASSVS